MREFTIARTERGRVSKLSMKFSLVPAVLGIIISLAGFTQAYNLVDVKDAKSLEKPLVRIPEKIERSSPVDPNASITLCVMSGQLRVRAWDKSEVRVRSADAAQIDFRRVDKAKDLSTPPTRVDVMVFDKLRRKGDCQALANVEMEVPSGATVQVQTRDGNIYITGVAGAYAGSQNGDIMIERAGKFVEAGSIGGSILLKDSTGRINLSSAGGGVEVNNVKPVSSDDSFEVGTVSGDIQLNRVSNAKVIVKTLNGNVNMIGPLARAGHYGFTTMGGDVVLMLPQDVSFTLNARVSDKSDILSDFALKYLPEPVQVPSPAPKPDPPAAVSSKSPKSPVSKGKPPEKGGPVIAPVVVVKPVVVNPFRRVSAIYGSGDATISLSSFGGTLRLKKM
jgi:DUF4097 and DUF4098 domain-containing protein YvlB